MEALDERVAWVELIDADPALELVEAHEIEHECGAHDARRVPCDLVERLAQQASSREHPVPHIYERVGFDTPEVLEVRRKMGWALAHGLDRGDADVAAAAALLAQEPEVLLTVR